VSIDRKAVASQILADVADEIRATEGQIEVLSEHLQVLKAQETAARILAGLEKPQNPPKPNGSTSPPIQLERVRNMGELTYKFLRDQNSVPVSIPNLYKRLRHSVGNVGSRTYIYKIVADLIEEGLVEKDTQGRVSAKRPIAENKLSQTGLTQ